MNHIFFKIFNSGCLTKGITFTFLPSKTSFEKLFNKYTYSCTPNNKTSGLYSLNLDLGIIGYPKSRVPSCFNIYLLSEIPIMLNFDKSYFFLIC